MNEKPTNMPGLLWEIREWSNCWATGLSSDKQRTYERELAVYPPNSVTKALAKARKEWDRTTVPPLQFVLDRLPEAQGAGQCVSALDWGSEKRGLELIGPAWDNPSENTKATLEAWADDQARWGNWHRLSHPSVTSAFARHGATFPVKPEPRQGVLV